MNKYLVKDRVKGDIEFTIEAENMVDAVAKCRKYIEETYSEIFFHHDCFEAEKIFGFNFIERTYDENSETGYVMTNRTDLGNEGGIMSKFDISIIK